MAVATLLTVWVKVSALAAAVMVDVTVAPWWTVVVARTASVGARVGVTVTRTVGAALPMQEQAVAKFSSARLESALKAPSVSHEDARFRCKALFLEAGVVTGVAGIYVVVEVLPMLVIVVTVKSALTVLLDCDQLGSTVWSVLDAYYLVTYVVLTS